MWNKRCENRIQMTVNATGPWKMNGNHNVYSGHVCGLKRTKTIILRLQRVFDPNSSLCMECKQFFVSKQRPYVHKSHRFTWDAEPSHPCIKNSYNFIVFWWNRGVYQESASLLHISNNGRFFKKPLRTGVPPLDSCSLKEKCLQELNVYGAKNLTTGANLSW